MSDNTKEYEAKTQSLAFLEKRSWQYVFLVFIAFIWGTSFILMKKGLQTYSANQVAALRIFLSFVLFIPFIIKTFRQLSRENVLPLMVVGIIGNGIPAILFTTGQTEISSSLAGILNSLVPLFTLIVGWVLFKSSTAWINILGIIIGLGGTIGLILLGGSHLKHGNPWFTLYIILAAFCYSISANVIKHKLKDLNGVSIAALTFLFIGPLAAIYLAFTDMSAAWHSPGHLLNLGYIFILAFFSSFLAVILFNILIKYTTTIFATSVTYVIPVFAVFWGVLDGEKMSFFQILCMFIILLGVYLVNKKQVKVKG